MGERKRNKEKEKKQTNVMVMAYDPTIIAPQDTESICFYKNFCNFYANRSCYDASLCGAYGENLIAPCSQLHDNLLWALIVQF